MRYTIIETGSKGNAVVFNDVVLVDCGVSFKKLVPYYLNLQVVLLTHIHSDHFCKSTIKRLAAERPTLRFVCPEWLVPPLVDCGVNKLNIDICKNQETLWHSNFSLVPFDLEHDVENTGYVIWFEKETEDLPYGYESVVYATDTCTLPDIPGHDYYFIEANFKNVDELAERIRAKEENGEFVYEDRLQDRHMSEEYATNWLVRNGKPSSQHVFLHEHQVKEV